MSLNPITIYKEIAAYLKVKKEISTMSFSELKTSEGRLHLIGQIALIYSSIAGFIPAPIAAKISLIGFGIYTAARAIVKATQAIGGIVPKIAPIADEAAKELDAIPAPATKP